MSQARGHTQGFHKLHRLEDVLAEIEVRVGSGYNLDSVARPYLCSHTLPTRPRPFPSEGIDPSEVFTLTPGVDGHTAEASTASPAPDATHAQVHPALETAQPPEAVLVSPTVAATPAQVPAQQLPPLSLSSQTLIQTPRITSPAPSQP